MYCDSYLLAKFLFVVFVYPAPAMKCGHLLWESGSRNFVKILKGNLYVNIIAKKYFRHIIKKMQKNSVQFWSKKSQQRFRITSHVAFLAHVFPLPSY